MTTKLTVKAVDEKLTNAIDLADDAFEALFKYCNDNAEQLDELTTFLIKKVAGHEITIKNLTERLDKLANACEEATLLVADRVDAIEAKEPVNQLAAFAAEIAKDIKAHGFITSVRF